VVRLNFREDGDDMSPDSIGHGSSGKGSGAKIPSIEFEKYTLANGLDVILHEDHKLPVVHVNLWYHVGSKNEKPGKTGFAHLFEHMMFEGSRNVKGEYVSLMEKAGANIFQGGVNGTTDFDRTNYFETVPSGSLELVLWAESDRMAYLLDALTQENLDNQRDVVKNERRQSMDNMPYGRAVEILFENLFPKGHPYSWHIIGKMEDITNASREDVIEFFKTYYTPNNCTLVVAGDLDSDEARRLVEKYFGPISPGPPLARPERYVVALESDRRLVVRDRIPQERLYLAWPAVPFFESDDAALDLVSNVLSEGKNSRLYKRMVYDEQLASEVSAFNYSLEIAGMLGVVATARPGVPLSQLESLVHEEIAGMAKGGPTEEELDRIKAKREFDFVSGLERIGGFGGKADRLALYNTYLGSPDFIRDDYDRYQKLTCEDLRSAAERYLLGKPHLALSFVPESASKPSVSEPDRSKRPEIRPSSVFSPPDVASSKLSNGLKLRVVERHEIPKVAVGLMVNVGATADAAGKEGLASITAEMMDEGTKSRSALEIEAELERMGSYLSTGASREWSLVSLDTLERHLAPSLELMTDVVLRPSFPEEELERLRKQVLDGILQEKANPNATAGRVVRKVLFGSAHPYGWPVSGDEASVQSFERGDLAEFYRTHYSPADACLIMVGDVKLKDAKDLAEKAFSGWKAAGSPAIRVEPVGCSGRRAYLVDRPGAPQSEVRLAMPAPERSTSDYFSLQVLNNVLGGGFSSRLNLNLRENKGYSYGAFSALRFGRFQSLFLGIAPVETGVTKEAVHEMLAEFEAISSWERPVTEQELDDAKATLVRGYAQRYETLAQIAGEIAELEGFDLPMEELAGYTSHIEAVSLDHLEAAAGKYIPTKDFVLVVVGDLHQVEPGIGSLDLDEVIRVDAEGNPVT
jgi:zinc protease